MCKYVCLYTFKNKSVKAENKKKKNWCNIDDRGLIIEHYKSLTIDFKWKVGVIIMF